MPANSSSKTKIEELDRLSKNWEEPYSAWTRWGAYVSERAWGTVREDYSANGDPWTYFPYDLAAQKTFRWGEDAIAGWCDRYQVLNFAPSFWNEADSHLKERFFGLSTHEGNHGEDVKECYYHLDATPSNSYMKFLYRYPHRKFPYEQLRTENARRGTLETEFEIYDTGVFDENRFFDIVIEYAKASPEDLCIRITALNCGPEDAPLHLIPQLWFRNQWSWSEQPLPKPLIKMSEAEELCLVADDREALSPPALGFDYHLGLRYFYAPKNGKVLFTENETPKDLFHRVIVQKQPYANEEEKGTKACIHYHFPKIGSQKSVVLEFRFSDVACKNPLKEVAGIIEKRKKEADEFYEHLFEKQKGSQELKQIQRQALAGLIWTKQIYLYDVDLWLKGDKAPPPPDSRYHIRNIHWRHLNSMRIMSMPDKWEYPWFAAWDLVFQAQAFSMVDMAFAKNQMWLLLFDQFQHPNGQIPAYEWEFSDLNPPLQAWGVFHLYMIEKEQSGKGDREFLEKCFHKLLMNFAWWVNKVDRSGNNVFEGGFLGLDNIALFDRSQRLDGAWRIEQSDGTGWMAMFTLFMMRIAFELAKEDKVYESLATKFFQHFAYIASAIKKKGDHDHEYELWSETDGFFYDVIFYPDGRHTKCRIRSMVGIIPFFACLVYDQKELESLTEFYANFRWFLDHRKELVEGCLSFKDTPEGKKILFMPMNEHQRECILRHIWNPEEFHSPYGLRSLSKFHDKHPFRLENRILGYEPAESKEKMKGGNSNWRGPIWIQMNFLLFEALERLQTFYGPHHKVEAPGLPAVMLKELSDTFAKNLVALFCKDQTGKRPCLGSRKCFMENPKFQEHVLFYEYFHAETGEGLGASHQTGWTALIANIIQKYLP